LLDFNLSLNDCRAAALDETCNEAAIEALDEIVADDTIGQLTLARITELALICAGNYADHFEFSAAGGLLVNPRLIHVHIKGRIDPVEKNRHLALTQQLESETETYPQRIQWLCQNTHVETVNAPLLPYLYDRLKDAGTISLYYLAGVQRRMQKISQTIGFLSACRLPDLFKFYQTRQFLPKAERDFIAANLCGFNTDIFFALGQDIVHLIANDHYKSTFIRSDGDPTIR